MDAALEDFTLDELKDLRKTAVQKLNELVTGQRTSSGGFGDQRATFQESSRQDLELWIGQLNGAIRALETGAPARGPITLGL